MQSIGTDGRVFQFLVFQLNTTEFASNDGVKNLVWIDSDQLMYTYAQRIPTIKKKVVTVSWQDRELVSQNRSSQKFYPSSYIWDLGAGTDNNYQSHLFETGQQLPSIYGEFI